MSMTLDELRSECEEAAETGALVELDALTALTLVGDCIDYNAAMIRLETMLGHGADGGPSMDAMLDEVRAMMADFAALKAVVSDWKSSRDDYCKAISEDSFDFQVLSAAQEKHGRHIKALADLAARLEPKRPSPVLEIAGMNHE